MEPKASKPTENAGEASVAAWRDKYLGSLADQEKDRQDTRRLVELLRRNLVRMSLVVEGVDDALHQKFTHIGEELKDSEASIGLEGLLEETADDLLRLDASRSRQSRDLRELVNAQIQRLAERDLVTRPEQLASLQAIQEKASLPPDQPGTDLALLSEWCEFLLQLLAPVGKPIAAGSPQEAAGQDAQFDELDAGQADDLLNSLTEVGLAGIGGSRNVHPLHAADRASHSSASETGDASFDSLPGECPQNDTDLESVEISNAVLLNEVGQFLKQVTEGFLTADSVKASAAQLNDNLVQVSNESLADALQQALNLINLARADEHRHVTAYLQSVDDSLARLSEMLQGTHKQHKVQSNSSQNLDMRLRLGIEKIQGDLTSHSSLDDIKQIIDGRLEGMLHSLDEADTKRQESEATYSSQLQKLADKIDSMEAESRRLHKSVQKQQECLYQDPATGIHNLPAFRARLAEEFAVWQVTTDPLAVCFGQIDDLAGLQESCGEKAAERAMKVIASEVEAMLGVADFVSRHDHDRFAVILPNCSAQEARQRLQEVNSAIAARKFRSRGETLQLTMSWAASEFMANDLVDGPSMRAQEALGRLPASSHNNSLIAKP